MPEYMQQRSTVNKTELQNLKLDLCVKSGGQTTFFDPHLKKFGKLPHDPVLPWSVVQKGIHPVKSCSTIHKGVLSLKTFGSLKFRSVKSKMFPLMYTGN